MTPKQPIITGLGAFTAAGKSPEELWQNCANGVSGIVAGVGSIALQDEAAIAATIGSVVFFARKAALQAMKEAGWSGLREDDALIVATTTGNLPVWEGKIVEHLQGKMNAGSFREFFRTQPLGFLTEALRSDLGEGGKPFIGRSTLLSSACSAATQALALAAMWIKAGEAKRVLVVGTEVLCRLTLEGFQSLQLLSSETTKPFDVARTGINLSEGAGALCVETIETSRSKNLARLSGYGLSTDGYHMTSPHPEGEGSLRAMNDALKNAGVTPRDISWIHAHGTGSRHNDSAESAALLSLFSGKTPPVTSTKNIHGHALGASGAIEAVLCVEAIRRQKILPNFGHSIQDPEISIQLSTTATIAGGVKHVLKNTLGFGGANAALVFSAGDLS